MFLQRKVLLQRFPVGSLNTWNLFLLERYVVERVVEVNGNSSLLHRGTLYGMYPGRAHQICFSTQWV